MGPAAVVTSIQEDQISPVLSFPCSLIFSRLLLPLSLEAAEIQANFLEDNAIHIRKVRRNAF